MAASVPGIPDMPHYVSSTSSTITVGWTDVADNGGSVVSSYNVYADTGDITVDTFNLIGSTELLEFTLDKTVLT